MSDEVEIKVPSVGERPPRQPGEGQLLLLRPQELDRQVVRPGNRRQGLWQGCQCQAGKIEEVTVLQNL